MEESVKHEIVQIFVNVIDLNSAQYIVDILDFKTRWNKCTNHADGACVCACKYGYIDCLRYAHENGCLLNKFIYVHMAAQNGHIDCLQYLHENGCPWSKLMCTEAAENGQIDCLRYLHENGCPWDEYTCAYAAQYLSLIHI